MLISQPLRKPRVSNHRTLISIDIGSNTVPNKYFTLKLLFKQGNKYSVSFNITSVLKLLKLYIPHRN